MPNSAGYGGTAATDTEAAQVRRWFEQGFESFSRRFPGIATKVRPHPFYVCPQCLRAFHEGAIDLLTREDVPPKSVGGKKIILTCGECNCRAGHQMDVHARREADIFDFFTGRLAEAQATIRTGSGRLPIRLSSKDNQVTMFGVPKAASPADNDGLKADFDRASLPDGRHDLRINLAFTPFSPARAEASWVRSAYLAFFAALGYRFVLRRELDEVRQRIAAPSTRAGCSFRIVRPDVAPEPLLTVIRSPETFRSFAMVYGQQVVLLPMYGGTLLYARLAQQPASHVQLSAEGVYPWPDRPLFLHDARP